MALTITITSHNQITRPVEVEVEVPPTEEGGEATIEKVTQQEHVGWDIAVNVKGSWGGTSTTFSIDDLPDTATEKDFEAWVKAKYKE
jgi:hypothetical protein